jgi:hypothetical protein
MKQYVQAFAQAAKQCASTLKTEHGIDVTSEDVMAQLVGRSRCDQRPDLDLDPDHCPYFAHVRKANPRDLQYAQSNQHRIIRRGIPYANSADDLGVLFVAYQASIGRQFEFIQTQWLGINTFPQPAVSGSRPGLSPERMPGADPLTAFATSGNRTVMFSQAGPLPCACGLRTHRSSIVRRKSPVPAISSAPRFRASPPCWMPRACDTSRLKRRTVWTQR